MRVPLEELLARYPGFRLATRDDNDALVAYFDRRAMGTASFEVQYQRAPNFFRLLEFQSGEAYVFVHEREGVIDGVGTMSLRPGWAGGEPVTVGYLGDLRADFDRSLLRAWRRLYAEVVQLAHVHGVRHLVTAIMADNRLARAALVSSRAGAPVYASLGGFVMCNLLLKLPWERAPRGVQVRVATQADREELVRFFEGRQARRMLGYRGELERRFASWSGFDVGSFLLARRAGELVGCVAPWSPSEAKRTVVSRLPAGLALMARVFPRRLPQAGEPLRLLYLTCLEADEPEVMRALVHAAHAVARREGYHAASLACFDGTPTLATLSGFVSQRARIELFSVHPPGTNAESLSWRQSDEPPSFEMALV